MRWFMDLFYPLMEGARYRRAGEAAEEEPGAWDAEALGKARQTLLVTFKRSGEAVPTPVNCGMSEDGRLFFRSEPQMAKIKRIANNPRVLVGPCNIRGKPRGPLAEGTARLVPEEDNDFAYSVVRKNWGPTMWPSEMAMDGLGVPVVYVEVSDPASGVGELP